MLKKYFWIWGFGFLFLIYSCQKEVPFGFKSEHGSDESEDMNGDCLSCHQTDVSYEKKPIQVGGTLFKTDLKSRNPGGYVRFYSLPGGKGTLIKELEIDDLGNFYMAQKLDWQDSIYPMVVSNKGQKMEMTSAPPHGSCNRCHGISTQPIFAE